MKTKTAINKKYSVTATLRLMKPKQSFVIPASVPHSTTLAHVQARQIGAQITTRNETKGVRVFLLAIAGPRVSKKVPYPIESGVKLEAAKAGRIANSAKPTVKAKAKVAKAKAKTPKPAPAPKKGKVAKSKAKKAPSVKPAAVIGA